MRVLGIRREQLKKATSTSSPSHNVALFATLHVIVEHLLERWRRKQCAVRTPGFPEVTPEMLLGFAVLGIGALVAAALNLVFAFFAYRGLLWPAVLNTLGWCILLVPTLLHTNGQAIASAIVLAILVGMTAAIGVPRLSRG